MLRQRDRDYDVHDPALRGDAPKPQEHAKPCLYCKHWSQLLTRYDTGVCGLVGKSDVANVVDYLHTCDRYAPR